MLATDVANILAGTYSGYTRPLQNGGDTASYIVAKDSIVLDGTQPGPGREGLASLLVHELNHARNRAVLEFMEKDPTPTPARFVDGALAASLGGQGSMAP